MPSTSHSSAKNTKQVTTALLAQPLRVREELRAHIRGDASAAVLEDPIAGKHYRLGPDEYRFVLAADGADSFAQAWEQFAATTEGDPPRVTQSQAEKIYVWLQSSGLTSPGLPAQRHSSPLWQRVNPILFSLSLGNPDRLIDALVKFAQRLHLPTAISCLAGLLLAGCWVLIAHFGKFTADIEGLFTAGRLLTLGFTWCVLKVLHELGHGFSCKWFGGRVTDAGMAFILFAPVAFTDVSSSNAFPLKRQRVTVALAGMIVELSAAAIAVLIWYLSDSPEVRRGAVDAVLMASITSLAFNANPLMRFDGYYVLVEWLGIDNLYAKGQSQLRYCVDRALALPNRSSRGLSETNSDRFNGGLLAYGMACTLWRTTVGVAMIVAAASLLKGAGWLLAVLAAFTWFIAPLMAWVRQIMYSGPEKPLWTSQFAFRLGILATLIAMVCSVASPFARQAPAVAQFDPPALIRCRTPGFVESVHVVDGQQVSRGDRLLTLQDKQLTNQLAVTKTKWQLARSHERAYQYRGDASQLLLARAETARLANEIEQLQRKVDELVIRATSGGIVTARRIEDLHNSYLTEGQCIGEVGIANSKRLLVSLAPADAVGLEPGTAVRGIGCSGTRWKGVVDRIEPRASLQPPHPTLIAPFDGPLAVNCSDSEQCELIHPRVTAYVDVEPTTSESLYSGQTCRLVLPPSSQNLFGLASEKLASLLTSLLLR